MAYRFPSVGIKKRGGVGSGSGQPGYASTRPIRPYQSSNPYPGPYTNPRPGGPGGGGGQGGRPGGGGVRPLWDPINDGVRPQPGPGGGGGGQGGRPGRYLWDRFLRRRGPTPEPKGIFEEGYESDPHYKKLEYTGNRFYDAYIRAYNQSVGANLKRYKDIMGGYRERLSAADEMYAGRAEEIEQSGKEQAANITGDMINRGLSMSTAGIADQTILGREQAAKLSQLTSQQAATQAQLQGDLLQFAERRTDEYPTDIRALAYAMGKGGAGFDKGRGVSHASMSNPDWRKSAGHRWPTINEPGGATSGAGSGFYGSPGWWHSALASATDPRRATEAQKAAAMGSMGYWGSPYLQPQYIF